MNEDVAKKIYNAIYDIEDVLRSGLDNTLDAKRNQLISPGNFDGGVSSIVEKALGGMHKSGTAKIVDIIDIGFRSSTLYTKTGGIITSHSAPAFLHFTDYQSLIHII